MSYSLVRKALFSLEAESAHEFASISFEAIANCVPPVLRRLGVTDSPVSFKGLQFPNRLGLAAGFDKSGRFLRGAQTLGFGFTEVGAVTPKAQAGHPKPRMWRYPSHHAVRNKMGFNNPGAWALAKALANRPHNFPVRVNLGKNADTPLESAVNDYQASLETLYGCADFFVVNVSSPNTKGLRSLQELGLDTLLGTLVQRSKELAEQFALPTRPLLVKLSPDGNPDTLPALAEAVLSVGVDGFVASNTTSRREDQFSDIPAEGGLSGPLLHERALEMVSQLRELSQNDTLIIGCGGVRDAQTYDNFLEAGADLVQLYTGLVYEGPGLIRKILKNSKHRRQ